MEYTELPRATTLVLDNPRIVANSDEVITGDKLSVCLVWNNLTNQNFKGIKADYKQYYKMLLHNKQISIRATRFALFDGPKHLFTYELPAYVTQ